MNQYLFKLSLSAIVLLVNSVNSFDWCKITCNGEKHTMCAYPAGGGDDCKDFQTKLSVDDMGAIIKTHNNYRRMVASGDTKQPKASNMMFINWDKGAGEIAQRWADQCKEDGHDKCRSTRTNEMLGQNVAMTVLAAKKDRVITIVDLIKSWFNEIDQFDPQHVDKFVAQNDLGKAGHYTQMVWAKTTHVGCGISVKETDTENRYRLVCNYLPAGNVENEAVYEKGEGCSKCPSNRKCSKEWPGLCSSIEEDKDKGKGGKIAVTPLPLITFIALLCL